MKALMAKGFTLIEMVAVIVILGIVSIGLIDFLGMGANVYVDAVGREQVVSQTRFMLERLSREIREALPNSVRVKTAGNVHCLEFVPFVASSTYINIPVLPESDSTSIRVVQHATQSVDANKIAVYPLNNADVYGTDPANDVTGNIFNLVTVPTNGTSWQDVTLAKSVRFDADSPTSRYYLIKNAIAYCVDTGNGEVRRHADYWPGAVQSTTPTNSGVLMAENIKAGSTPFAYSSATLVNNAVVQLNFEVLRNGEQVNFHHEVHLINVP